MPATVKKRARGFWNKERVFAEGKKHKNRHAWQLAQSRSYNIAWENGWLDEIIGREIVHGKWTRRAVLESGKKFKTKTEWRNSPESSAYVIAKRNGWLQELTHFEQELSFGERTILKWLLERDINFEKEKVFAGLRDKYPLRFDFWIPKKKLLIEYQGRQHDVGWSGDASDAREIRRRDRKKVAFAKREGLRLIYIDTLKKTEIHETLRAIFGRYKIRPLTDIEISRVRNLGGWSKERALEDAKKYRTRKAWGAASHGYAYARLNGFLDEACAHMERNHAWTVSRTKKWTKDAVLGDAKKYTRKIDWRNGSASAYVISRRNGWHSEATAHMTPKSGCSIGSGSTER
jgi:hypothetical protein